MLIQSNILIHVVHVFGVLYNDILISHSTYIQKMCVLNMLFAFERQNTTSNDFASNYFLLTYYTEQEATLQLSSAKLVPIKM